MLRTRFRLALMVSALALSSAACGGDPFALQWVENPEEATVYALDRPEPHLRSGFNLFERRPVRIEEPAADGRWDFAVERRDGTLYFLPPRVMGIRNSRAGLSPMQGIPWEDIREAPSDSTLYIFNEPVEAERGTVYVIQTHEQTGSFGLRCVYYGKVEPVELDVERGALTFLFDVSPDCNNRDLVPPGS